MRVRSGRRSSLQRSPPALIGFTRDTPTDILETCSSPTFLDQHDSGVGERLFVTCFADGEIYVFDPAVPRLVKTFPVGRGPVGPGVRRQPRPQRRLRRSASATTTSRSSTSQPGSPTEYHVIQRIGFPRVDPAMNAPPGCRLGLLSLAARRAACSPRPTSCRPTISTARRTSRSCAWARSERPAPTPTATRRDRAVHGLRPADARLSPAARRRREATPARRASIHNRTFAFVPNSASGDLSVIDADNWKIVDLNKATGGLRARPAGRAARADLVDHATAAGW